MTIWLRRIKFLPVVLSAVLSVAAVRWLVNSASTGTGATVPVETLWLALALSVPLLFLFVTEDSWDIVAVRAVRTRRLAIISFSVAVSAVVAFICYSNNFADYGFLAMLRNCWGLLGLGALSLTFLPKWAVWLVPAVVGMSQMIFYVPTYPGTAMTVWGALRMKGVLVADGGAIDLSWPLCLLVLVVGVAFYLSGCRWRGHLRIFRRRQFIEPDSDVMPYPPSGISDLSRKGVRRESFVAPLAALIVVVIIWTLSSSRAFWGGSVFLLMYAHASDIVMFAAPIACTGGVVAGQYRWRSSVAVWERLSDRGQMRVFWAFLAETVVWVGAATVAAVLVIAAACIVGESSDGVEWGVIWTEITDSLPQVLVSMFLVIAGVIVGVILGFLMRRIWISPAVFFLSLVIFALASARINEDDYRPWSADGYSLVCEGVSPRICADRRDLGYLLAFRNAVTEVYESSRFREILPKEVRVVDNAQSESRVSDAPVVGLAGHRKISAPGSVSEDSIRMDLTDTIAQACVPKGASVKETFETLLPGIDRVFAPTAVYFTDAEIAESEDSLFRAKQCFGKRTTEGSG